MLRRRYGYSVCEYIKWPEGQESPMPAIRTVYGDLANEFEAISLADSHRSRSAGHNSSERTRLARLRRNRAERPSSLKSESAGGSQQRNDRARERAEQDRGAEGRDRQDGAAGLHRTQNRAGVDRWRVVRSGRVVHHGRVKQDGDVRCFRHSGCGGGG